MKIEHFLYGMINGKIILCKTEGVNAILSDKNFQYLRSLTIEDSDQYLWLPTEELIALPHIEEVHDEEGRTWVQNRTLLIPIHDYLRLTNPISIFKQYFPPLLTDLPEKFEPIEICEETCQKQKSPS